MADLNVRSGPFKGKPQQWFTRADVQSLPWVRTSDLRPSPGALIVKRWDRNGAVWAGVYTGSDKDSSFDEWFALPPLPTSGGDKEKT